MPATSESLHFSFQLAKNKRAKEADNRESNIARTLQGGTQKRERKRSSITRSISSSARNDAGGGRAGDEPDGEA